MVNINSAISDIENKIKKMNAKDKLIIASFKKDRHIIIIKNQDLIDDWTLQTNGYTHENIENLTLKETLKLLKKYRDIEFPRSNKIFISIRKNSHV